MHQERIIVVEDEPALLETLVYNLEREGFEVEAISNGLKALESARSAPPDLMLLDIMLPGIDGFEVARLLRQKMSFPILMLTARDDEIDRVLGLELGADDYITKPFSMRELIARVKAQLRRRQLDREEMTHDESNAQMIFHDLMINTTRREVYKNDKLLTLKPKEFDLLLYFCQHHGKALSRENLIENVWNWDFAGGSRTVDVHVRWLREKIETDPAMPNRIVTVRGVGYRFDG